MKKILLKNPNILTIMISCIIIVILLLTSNGLRVLNKTIQNDYYSIKNDFFGESVNQHIIIAQIDDRSFKEIGTFPFPRSVYAKVLENLSTYEIAVIGLDVLFLDPSNSEDDTIFSRSLTLSNNIVLGSAYDTSGQVILPFSGLDSLTYTTGYLHPNVEYSNRTVYSFTPKITDIHANSYEHFAVKVLRSFHKYVYDEEYTANLGSYTNNEYLLDNEQKIPLARKNSQEILINFIPESLFTTISFSDLYDEKKLREINKKHSLKDSIILIGPAAEGLNDSFFTPNGEEYGVNIHANILNTLLQKNYMMYFDVKLEWLMIFLIVILSVLANLSPSNKVLLLSNFSIISIFWIIIPLSILLGTNLILNFPSEIIFSLILSVTSANIIKYLIADTNKQRLNKALSEYVGSNIADEILGEQGNINFDGEEKKLICFFSDIEGFTHLSEDLSPKELVAFLRAYLSAMTFIIMDKKGYIDKFQGDAIMALWGAFGTLEYQDYFFACESALVQQEKLLELNKVWSYLPQKEIKVRIGIHSGNAIVGNIGAFDKKMDFTALGDNVNLASRLEGTNKYYGTYICVSEIIYENTKALYEYRYLDEIQVKGKDIPVKIYELLGRKGEVSEETLQRCKQFESAVILYRNKNFIESQEIFSTCIKAGDNPSKTYFERCEYYKDNLPEEHWDAIWRMEEK